MSSSTSMGSPPSSKLGGGNPLHSRSNQSINSNITVSSYNSTTSSTMSTRSGLMTKMGSRLHSVYKRFTKDHTQLTEMDIQILSTLTNFSRAEVEDWHKKFLTDCPNGQMSRKQFINMYKGLFPKGDAERFAKHVFRAFDTDKSNYVDFKEFLSGLSMTSASSSPREKLEWTFHVFDIDGNGLITRKECCEVVDSIVRLQQHQAPPDEREQIAEEAKKRMMKIFDDASVDKLTMRQFVNGCERDEKIHALLLPPSSSSPTTP